MKHERRVLGNIIVLGSGELVAQLANFVFIILIARVFGPDILGLYSMSMAVSALAVVLVTGGAAPMLVRDIGADAADGGRLLRVIFPVQLSVAIAVWVAIVTAGSMLADLTVTGIGILAIIAAYQIFVKLGEVLLSEPQGRQMMVPVSIVRAGTPLLVLALALVLLWIDGRPAMTIGAMGISAVVFFFVSLGTARRLGGSLRIAWSFAAFVDALRRARPFFVIRILSTAYERLGIVILGVLATPAVVGTFAAGDRMIAAMGVLMNVLTSVSLPALSHLQGSDAARMIELASRLMRLTWLMSLPVATGLFLFSEDIMTIVFGETYLDAAVVLRVASMLVVIRALRAILAPISMAVGRQSFVATGRALALLILVLAAPVLIAVFGAPGLSGAMVVAEAGLVGFVILRLAAIEKLPSMIRPALGVGAACGCAVAVGFVGADWPLLVRIAVVLPTGAAGLYLFGALTMADVRLLLEMRKSKPARP